MRLVERSYSTKLHRPRPAIYTEPDGSFVIISTSWGNPEDGQKVNDDIAKYIQAAKADVEVTSPFEFLTALTNEANYLRIASLISNEQIYRSANKNEYISGVETLVLLHKGSQMAYAQVGAPHLLIQKPGRPLAPVAIGYEASLEMSGVENQILAPLPQTMLGIDASLNIRCGDFHVDEGDRLVLYAGSFWPDSLWTSSQANNLQQLTQKMVQQNPEAPFWLGVVDLENF
ncbi:hypothetical protein [Bdellovibrio sp. HCB337]|uniref:hypothetical protein n=1 Tax=Bdellovibrio sp. HCB337 TaxID=3394358 RepID=UPI0039A58965